MKNVSKEIEANNLLINVVECAFVAWLIRRGIYTAFKLNYDYDFSPSKSFVCFDA